MADNLGTKVSTVLDPEDVAYQLVVWQQGKPPTDAELNFLGQLNTEERSKIVRSLMPSGFIGSPNMAVRDWYFHTSFSNYFYLGRQDEVETDTESSETAGSQSILWAAVNGWMVPVIGTNVNEELVLSDTDFRNKIVLPFGPTSGFETNFVFLEVWQKLISVDPSTEGKPTASTIYKYGNVAFGGTNLSDDLYRADVNKETTQRVQLQYRLRMVDSVDAVSYPTGFGDTANVYARTNLTSGGAADLASAEDMAFYPVAGDGGLWRAGDGDPTTGLGTVDGYTYAIPVCMVRRRNRGGWAVSTTNGAVSRTNPPTGYVEGDPSTGCPLSAAELASAPTSDRPDSMYADEIFAHDVTDMRFHVQPGSQDYDAILAENIQALLADSLATTPKLFTVGGSQFGSSYLVTDELNATGTDNPSTILVGEPDGVRKLFTDVPVFQARNLEITAAASKEASSPSFGTDPSKWMPGDIISVPHPDSLRAEDYPSQFLTDQIKVTYLGNEPVAAGFVNSSIATSLTSTGSFTTFSADIDQWGGFMVEITGGVGQGQKRTITTIDSDDTITIGSAWSVNPDSTSSFIVRPPEFEATATADTTEMLVTITNINGATSSTDAAIKAANLQGDIWIEYVMHYPAGQGLSVIPAEVHRVNFTNPTSSVLLRAASTSGVNLLDLRSIEQCPDFANPATRANAADTVVVGEAYYDKGSKSIVVQPFQRVNVALVPRENSTFTPAHAYYSLFDTRYCLEVPSAYLPAQGYHSIPILDTASGVFYTGLHVWAMDESDAASEVIINTVGRSGFGDDTFVGNGVLSREDSIAYEALDSGTPDKIGCRVNPDVGGIELPSYIGLSRIIGIFEAGDFDTNGLGGTNVLATSVEGSNIDPNIWIGRVGKAQDVTFTVLPAAITNYAAATEYVVVANLFGFRQGFLTDNGIVTAHQQVSSVSETVTLSVVIPLALTSSAIAQITYTRNAYQGGIYNRYEPFGSTTPEPFNNRGLVSPTDLTSLGNVLTSVDLGTPFHYEVLATAEFVTTLGTARFSGLQNGRFYNLKEVNNSIPAGAPRHETLRLSDVSKNEAGFISRLPLGAAWRDADFAGEDILSGDGRGNFFFLGGSSVNPSGEIQNSTKPSAVVAPGSIITTSQGNISPSTLSQYRVTRGGAGYAQADGLSGGPLEAGGHQVQLGYRGLYCVAALVRNFEEMGPTNFELPVDATTNPEVLKGRAGELQMVILTSVLEPAFSGTQGLYHPQRALARISSAGIGEGDTALDRYRCVGRPLSHQPLRVPFVEDGTVVVSPADIARPGQPYLYGTFPSVVAIGDLVTVTGVNHQPSRTVGVEYFMRARASGPTEDWTPLAPYVVDFSTTSVNFRSTAVLGKYDLMARGSDGKVAILENAFEVGTSSGQNEVTFFENFMSHEVGKFPTANSILLEGWNVNHPRALRVSDSDSYVGDRCGLFTGTGRQGSDTAFREITSAGEFGTDSLSIQFSLKMLSATIPTGNTLSITLYADLGATSAPVASLTFTPATSFFTLVVHNELTGSGDVTLITSTVLDTDWHHVGILVDPLGVTSVIWDGSSIGDATYSGTILSSNYLVSRFTLDNTAVAAVTSSGCYVDRLYIVKL